MKDNQQKPYLNRGTFAIDIQYQGKEFYALVIPEPTGEDNFDYHVMIPGLFNFRLGYSKNTWHAVDNDDIDPELINVVSKEISFVCAID